MRQPTRVAEQARQLEVSFFEMLSNEPPQIPLGEPKVEPLIKPSEPVRKMEPLSRCFKARNQIKEMVEGLWRVEERVLHELKEIQVRAGNPTIEQETTAFLEEVLIAFALIYETVDLIASSA